VEECCQNCRFYGWHQGFALLATGQCKAHPQWVKHEIDDWCGEWQPGTQKNVPYTTGVVPVRDDLIAEETKDGAGGEAAGGMRPKARFEGYE
jgi:hypothetical protein